MGGEEKKGRRDHVMAHAVSRKKRLEIRVSALSDSRSQSTLDRFLIRHHYDRKEPKGTGGCRLSWEAETAGFQTRSLARAQN